MEGGFYVRRWLQCTGEEAFWDLPERRSEAKYRQASIEYTHDGVSISIFSELDFLP